MPRSTKRSSRHLGAAEPVDQTFLKSDEPIFIKSWAKGRRQAIHTASVSRIFKKRSGRDDVSAHSTRIGGVQDAFRLGCDLSSIMVAGRWMSPEMPAKYGRRILASQSAAAQVCAAFEDFAADELGGQTMENDDHDKPDTSEALIESFILSNHADLTEDPAQALQRIDRFLARFPAVSEENRRKVREAILGSLH